MTLEDWTVNLTRLAQSPILQEGLPVDIVVKLQAVVEAIPANELQLSDGSLEQNPGY